MDHYCAKCCGPCTRIPPHDPDNEDNEPGRRVTASDAWKIMKSWLADFEYEEKTFSRYTDDTILDGVMTAGLRRDLSALLSKTSTQSSDAPAPQPPVEGLRAIFERCARIADTFGIGRERSSYGGTDIAVRIRADGIGYCDALTSPSLTAGEPQNWREVELVRLINLLRSEEGDSVTILSDNPDPRIEAENNAVVCNGSWTNWEDRRFSGVGLLDALSAAMIEYMRPPAPATLIEQSGAGERMREIVRERVQNCPIRYAPNCSGLLARQIDIAREDIEEAILAALDLQGPGKMGSEDRSTHEA